MKRIKRILIIISLFIFCLLAYLVLQDKTYAFDTFVYNLVTFYKNDLFSGFYKFITMFSSEVMILLISLMFFIIFKNKKYGFFVILNVINILILCILLKVFFGRDRPYDLMIITETGYSFPSGHAMAALGIYGFIIYLIWHFNLEKRAKIIFTSLLGILIFLIGVSRIYLGVHYASDVLAGYMISFAYLIIYITYVSKYLKFDNSGEK